MLMILGDEEIEHALPRNEVADLIRRHGEFQRDLAARGAYLESYRLRPSREAVTLRPEGGDGRAAVALDGPFAETKEVLGGYYLIEAPSRDEAIAWAKRLPVHESGAVEVRPARTGALWRGPIRQADRWVIQLVVDREHQAARTREDVFRDIDNHYELSLPLAADGKFVSSRSLEPPTAAATIRSRGAVTFLSDGPFTETKEFVAGYFVLACDTKPEALAWAQKLRGGADAVEIRRVWPRSEY
ncbi:MAG TPA: YciI family protein [Candidatus Binatia bacterium]|nr:YciI family protein [Candidatus Binatia bacterium]